MNPWAHTSATKGPADFLCLLCFRSGASAARAGVPRTGRRVQSNLIILSWVAENGQTARSRAQLPSLYREGHKNGRRGCEERSAEVASGMSVASKNVRFL